MLNPGELPVNERKAQFGVIYLRAVAAVAGFDVSEPTTDFDSIDLKVDSRLAKRHRLEFQIKCTARAETMDPEFGFELPKKNYEDLRAETIVPRLLLVVVVPEDFEDCLAQNERRMHLRRCGYWASLREAPERSNVSSVTVTISRNNLLTPVALSDLMSRAWEASG